MNPEEKLQFEKLRKELNYLVNRVGHGDMSSLQKFMFNMRLTSKMKQGYKWSLKAQEENRIIDSLLNGRPNS